MSAEPSSRLKIVCENRGGMVKFLVIVITGRKEKVVAVGGIGNNLAR